jgi:cardiolipin synthase
MLILLGAVAYYFLMEPFDGHPALVSKLNTLCQLLLVFVVLAQPSFPIVPSGAIPALTGIVGFTTTVSGAWYVVTWGRRFFRRLRKNES